MPPHLDRLAFFVVLGEKQHRGRSSALIISGEAVGEDHIVALTPAQACEGLDGQPEIQISINRNTTKGIHNSQNRPEYPIFETTTGLLLPFNPILFFFTIALANVENLSKANEPINFARKSGAKVFQTYYMAEGSVDRQNSFLNQPLRKDHIKSFRGITPQYNPELWQSLPAQMQYELEHRPDFVALEEEIEDLAEEMKKTTDKEANQELQTRQNKLYKEQQRLILEELKKRRRNQPCNHPSNGGREPSQGDLSLTVLAI
ncbi:hypothetical protein B7494_g1911 [Chlorociboria aeruginascens]|nr:hypothetical protein B7494_g1911 [Chlorociboria aeruginascens]